MANLRLALLVLALVALQENPTGALSYGVVPAQANVRPEVLATVHLPGVECVESNGMFTVQLTSLRRIEGLWRTLDSDLVGSCDWVLDMKNIMKDFVGTGRTGTLVCTATAMRSDIVVCSELFAEQLVSLRRIEGVCSVRVPKAECMTDQVYRCSIEWIETEFVARNASEMHYTLGMACESQDYEGAAGIQVVALRHFEEHWRALQANHEGCTHYADLSELLVERYVVTLRHPEGHWCAPCARLEGCNCLADLLEVPESCCDWSPTPLFHGANASGFSRPSFERLDCEECVCGNSSPKNQEGPLTEFVQALQMCPTRRRKRRVA
eukprot:3385798-Amphidinium_carterae.1